MRTGANGVVCQGIRGTITVRAKRAEDLPAGTAQLPRATIEQNGLHDPVIIASAGFTTATDLTSAFPAIGGRDPG